MTEQQTGPAPKADIYCTDDYPREGCTLTIKVSDKAPPYARYLMFVTAPNGAVIESYRTYRTSTLVRRVRDWCEGRAPIKGYDRDQEIAQP